MDGNQHCNLGMEVDSRVDFMQEQHEQHWQMPDWWYRKKRPSTDEEYFENMSRVIFQAGLNWHVIDNKWPLNQEGICKFQNRKSRMLH